VLKPARVQISATPPILEALRGLGKILNLVFFVKVANKVLVPEVEISFCPYCGKKLDNEYSFCPYCGQNLAAESTPIANKSNTKPKVNKIYGIVKTNQASNVSTNDIDNSKEERSHPVLRMIGSLICGIFVILCIAASRSITKEAVRGNPSAHIAPQGYTPEIITDLVGTVLLFAAFCLLFQIIQKESGQFIFCSIIYLIASIVLCNFIGAPGMVIAVVVGIYLMFKFKK
jgi:hypothetical protein